MNDPALLTAAAERAREYEDCRLLLRAAEVLERMGYRTDATRLREISES